MKGKLNKIITCKGQLIQREYRGNWYATINYSDIFSFLIKEVADKVKSYHSDLYYSLKDIEGAITKANPKSTTIYVCLRDSGVDGNDYYQIIKNNPDIYGKDVYIAIYKVDINVNYDEREIEISLIEEEK